MRLLGLTLVLSFALSGSEIPELVSRLGSPRYSQREDATAALEKLGRQAIPALKLGRHSRDPEIRNRSVAIYDKIASSLLVSPTQVSFDGSEHPLEHAVAMVSTQSGLPMRLLESSPEASRLKVRFPSAEPRSFWEVVEALAAQGGMVIQSDSVVSETGGASTPQGMISLFPIAPGTRPAPSSISGPFRVSLEQMTRQLTKDFVAQGDLRSGNLAIVDPTMRAAGSRRSSDHFQLSLMVMAEPRMRMSIAGPVQLHQAEDDLGNSLMPPALNNEGTERDLFNARFATRGNGPGQTSVALRYPENPGRTIKILRGMIPLQVSSRKEDPLAIRLADAQGKSYRSPDTILTVNEVRIIPNLSEYLLDLTVRAISSHPAELVDPDPFTLGSQAGLASQIELYDQGGTLTPRWSIMSQSSDQGGIRITIRVAAGQNEPVELRYYDIANATAQAEFTFTEIPMP